MKMMLTLALLPVLALSAAAQETPWSDAAIGDRVEITFHSGATIGGTVIAAPRTAPAASLTVDVTWEYPGLNGTLTVPQKEIKTVRKLRVLDDATRRRLAEMKKQIAEENAKAAVPPPAPAATPDKPLKPEVVPDEKAVKDAQELQKAREFFAKYPAPDWSPERRNAIRLKLYRGQAPTLAEREFEAGYALWEKGRAAAGKTPAEPRKD